MDPKIQELTEYFNQYKKSGICIAYSGGVDSTLLLKLAVEAASSPVSINSPEVASAPASIGSLEAASAPVSIGSPEAASAPVSIGSPEAPSVSDPRFSRPVLAVILSTQLHPHSDTEAARKMAETLGADCEIVQVNEFEDPQIMHNPVNRCYLCKHLLFSRLKALASEKGYETVFDGTNKDDEKEYRPGRKVLKELGIRSPLLELGITKAQVRSLSADLQLPTASMPSTPCLATRLPYGAYLDQTLLGRIHQGEEFLRQMGFYNVRLRFHDPVLRIETDCASFDAVIRQREAIVTALKNLGFSYVTLDLEGFRSGSMDIHIEEAAGNAD